MLRIILYLFFTILSFYTTAQNLAALRIANMAHPGPLTLQITGKEAQVEKILHLQPRTVTEYMELAAGEYLFVVFSKTDTLLKTTYGLGRADMYSLLICGRVYSSLPVNPKTSYARLRDIFGGVETKDPNGSLPQMRLIADVIIGDTARAYVSAVHCIEGAGKLLLELHDKNPHTVAHLKYPDATHRIKEFSPGSYELQVKYHEAAPAILKKTVYLAAGKLTTFYITSGGQEENNYIQIIEGQSPVR